MDFPHTPLSRDQRVPSLDALLLIVLVLPFLAYNEAISLFLVLAVSGYVLVDLLLPFVAQSHNEKLESRRHTAFKLKFLLLLSIIGAVIIFPTIYYMWKRPIAQPDAHLQDGAYQTEVALRYLTNGRNPYAETYAGTGVERYFLPGASENPAAFHFVYFPFVLWISLPFYSFSTTLFHWYDQRLVYLLSFLVMLFLLTRMTNERPKKLTLLVLVALNAYTSDFLQYGFNDVLVLVLLLAVVLFLRNNRLTLAALFLGFASATKPSAWFMIPFVSVYITGTLSWKTNARLWIRQMFPFWLALLATVGPFLIWNADALYRSTIAYPMGFEGTALYPIRGYGIGTWLLALGIISSPLSPFPFWILQLFASIPVLLFMLYYQQHNNTIAVLLLGYAAFFLSSVFFSRFFQGNYLHYALLVLFLAWLIDPFRFRSNFDSASTLAP